MLDEIPMKWKTTKETNCKRICTNVNTKETRKCFFELTLSLTIIDYDLYIIDKRTYTRLGCFDVTAILSWDWLKLKWT